MKTKIVGILVCTLLIVTIFPILADNISSVEKEIQTNFMNDSWYDTYGGEWNNGLYTVQQAPDGGGYYEFCSIGKKSGLEGESLSEFADTQCHYTTIPTRAEHLEILDALPYYLEGTILNGSVRTVVTENGSPPDNMTYPDDYDYCINFSEMENISETARQQFITAHGIDPYLPEPDGPIELAYADWLENTHSEGSGGGPHAINGLIVLKIIPARDEDNKPDDPNSLIKSVKKGFAKFSEIFAVSTSTSVHFGEWDASDVGPPAHIHEYRTDLWEDCWYLKTKDNQILFGWVRDAETTGEGGGFHACAKESSWFHPKMITRHEVSHCFGAPDHGFWWPPCMMTYFWLLFFWTWCNSCENTVYDNIWEE